jgi:hypothetical protein
MRLDLDELASEWDLVVRWRGRDWRVAPVRVMHLAALAEAGQAAGQSAGRDPAVSARLTGVLETMFAEPRPPLAECDVSELQAIVQLMTSYVRERTEKNSRRASKAIAALLARETAGPAAAPAGR